MIIIGTTNAIRGAIASKTIKKLFVLDSYSNNEIIKGVKDLRIPIEVVDKNKLKSLCKDAQGCAALIEDIHTVGIDEIIHDTKKVKSPIVVMLDELNDPHNLGAILRSCDAFGVSGVVFKKKGQISLNETVIKTSTGAAMFIKCAEVTNLTQAIKTFKSNGFWVVGLDGDGKSTFNDLPKDLPILLVVGSEGFGISRLVKENCDFIARIDMYGQVNCLNASVACGIGLYALRQHYEKF